MLAPLRHRRFDLMLVAWFVVFAFTSLVMEMYIASAGRGSLGAMGWSRDEPEIGPRDLEFGDLRVGVA